MTNDQLDQLVQDAPEELRTVLGDLCPHIKEACAAVLEETQDEGGKPKVKVAIGLSIDLSKHPAVWTMEGSVGIKRKVTGDSHQLEDPDQPELAGLRGETSMTIQSGDGHASSISGSQARKALRTLSKEG